MYGYLAFNFTTQYPANCPRLSNESIPHCISCPINVDIISPSFSFAIEPCTSPMESLLKYTPEMIHRMRYKIRSREKGVKKDVNGYGFRGKYTLIVDNGGHRGSYCFLQGERGCSAVLPYIYRDKIKNPQFPRGFYNGGRY